MWHEKGDDWPNKKQQKLSQITTTAGCWEKGKRVSIFGLFNKTRRSPIPIFLLKMFEALIGSDKRSFSAPYNITIHHSLSALPISKTHREPKRKRGEKKEKKRKRREKERKKRNPAGSLRRRRKDFDATKQSNISRKDKKNSPKIN